MVHSWGNGETSVLFVTLVNHYICCYGSNGEYCPHCLHLKNVYLLSRFFFFFHILSFVIYRLKIQNTTLLSHSSWLLVTRMYRAPCWSHLWEISQNLKKIARGVSRHTWPTWLRMVPPGGMDHTPHPQPWFIHLFIYFLNANSLQLLQCLWLLQRGAFPKSKLNVWPKTASSDNIMIILLQ